MNWITDLIHWLSKLFQWWVIIMPWERGLRVRLGKRVVLLTEGVYLKLPLIDSVYVQTTRNRMISLPVQTLTTKDNKTLSVVVSCGYIIEDIKLLYNTLYHPEMTIANMVLGSISEHVAKSNLLDNSPESIEKAVLSTLNVSQYGIGNLSIKVIGYAVVRTYRLIQDTQWIPEGFRLDQRI